MGDIKVFKLNGDHVTELEESYIVIEKSLQTIMEKHLETFLGVHCLASEYFTGKAHNGYIDTLGIDENGCPTIIEYKRTINANVINQALFYLDWLKDHKAEFEKIVSNRLGKQEADSIEWLAPRLLCIASDFTRYDKSAVQQIDRNIALVRYSKYGEDTLLLEQVNATTARPNEIHPPTKTQIKKPFKSVEEYLDQSDEDLKELFESLKAYLLSQGDDVQQNALKHYYAFKRIKNFACVEVHPQSKELIVYVKVDPGTVNLVPNFTQDVRDKWHFGTGDLKITIGSRDDLEKAKPFIDKSYEIS
jgi:predicted transport protein